MKILVYLILDDESAVLFVNKASEVRSIIVRSR